MRTRTSLSRAVVGLTASILLLAPVAAHARSADEVAKELANPNSSLGFFAFPMDYVRYNGDLKNADEQDSFRVSFQPSLPYPIGEKTNLFVRPLIPIIFDQPVPKPPPGRFQSEGLELGDISFDAAIGHSFSHGIQVIGGMVGTLPTATDADLGLDQLLLGPELFVGQKTSWGFYGVLVSHQWDAAGDRDFETSITGGQYFYTIDLKDAWQIQAQPTFSYNHKADPGEHWTVPVGVGLSKTLVFGKTPVKFSVQYWNYVLSPDTFGPEHQIRFQFAPVVPLPW